MGAACGAINSNSQISPRRSNDKKSRSSQLGDTSSKANSLSTSPISATANPVRARGGGKSLSPKQRLSEGDGIGASGGGVTFAVGTPAYNHAPAANANPDLGLRSQPSSMSLLLPLVRQETALYEGGGAAQNITTARTVTTVTTDSSFGRSYNSNVHPLDEGSRRLSNNVNPPGGHHPHINPSAAPANSAHFMGHSPIKIAAGRSNYCSPTAQPLAERKLSGGAGLFSELPKPPSDPQLDRSIDIKDRTEVYDVRPMRLAMPAIPGSLETDSNVGSPTLGGPPMRRSTFANNEAAIAGGCGVQASASNMYNIPNNGKGAFSSADGDQSSIFGGPAKASVRGLEDTFDSFKFNKEVPAYGLSDGPPLSEKGDKFEGLPRVAEY